MPYRPKSPQDPQEGAAPSGDDAATTQSEAPQVAPDAQSAAPDGPTKARKTLWLVGIGVGLYFIGTGIYQAIMAGQS